jgi:hypothetical protein
MTRFGFEGMQLHEVGLSGMSLSQPILVADLFVSCIHPVCFDSAA